MTVRALHHYDDIGLLSPSERTSAGHRRYTEADVRRLYRLRALRSLGLSLPDIGSVLSQTADDGDSLRQVLERQREAIAYKAAQLQQLQDQIQHLVCRLNASRRPDADELLNLLERMTVFENYFTPEQQAKLAERRGHLGDEGVEQAKSDWTDLVREGLALIGDDVPATDPRAQDLVRRWDELGSQFHAGEDTKAAAREMWRENSASLSSAGTESRALRKAPWGAAAGGRVEDGKRLSE